MEKGEPMSINAVTISGNIGREPEIRATQSGTSVLTFSLAVNERVKKGDSWEEYVNWIDVVVFGRRADSLSKILAKGMKVAVSGHLRYSTWERDNVKRSKIEVIADDVDIMQRRDGSQGQSNGSYGQQYQQQGNYSQQQQYGYQNGSQQQSQGYQQPQMDVYDEDCPFSYPTLG
jgi:single-strand DNA-binding protein